MTSDDGIAAEAELCDLCGLVITDGSQVYALADDGARQPLARRQLLTACTVAHLDELRRRAR